MPEPGDFKLQAEIQDEGIRLDAYLAVRIAELSRSYATALIQQNQILVNTKPQKPSYKLRSGDRISVHIPPPVPTRILPESINLDIIFEDRDFIILNKPAGLVVHPAAGHSSGTLVNALIHYCPDLEGIGGEQRPGIVHRLDKDTSGLMIVAKNATTHNLLSQQFKDRRIKKQYLAIISGAPTNDNGRIDLPIGRHQVDRKKMSTRSARGRLSVTAWRVIKRYRGAAMIEADLITGRTHQIRVHFQAIGHPLIGDPVYGNKRILRQHLGPQNPLNHLLTSIRRQMLHAHRLILKHPQSWQPMTFTAPIPQDMIVLLNQLDQFAAL